MPRNPKRARIAPVVPPCAPEVDDARDLVSDRTTALCRAGRERALLEAALLTGWYHAISFAVRALRLPFEPSSTPIEVG